MGVVTSLDIKKDQNDQRYIEVVYDGTTYTLPAEGLGEILRKMLVVYPTDDEVVISLT